MYHFIFRIVSFVSIVLFSFSCTTAKRTGQSPTGMFALKYLGGYEIPADFKFKNTVVGGLSGIDYDAGNNLYYLISDDRSEKNPARFYTAKIFFTQRGIDSLVFTDVISLLQRDGNVYPNNKADRFKTPDPESIRYNPVSGNLVWSSEGERTVRKQDTVLTDPAILLIKPDGKYIKKFVLPGNLKMQANEKGPRKNGVLEGMSFADHFRTLYVNVEEPLYEDGPRADLTDNNAFIRIIKFKVAGKKSVAQYAYKLEPVAHEAVPQSEFKINGVSEILSLGNDRLLVIERSFSSGRLSNTIKLFIADLHEATDVHLTALKDNHAFIPAAKSLVLNMDDLGIYTDNIEGVTFGPVLPNGHKTLLFIADNNFSAAQKAQVLLFELLEK